RHTWGTHNRLVQTPGFFVELLTVAEPEKLGSDGLSALFGTFNRLFLKDQEGLSLLILESSDAAADAARFRSAGIGASDAMRHPLVGGDDIVEGVGDFAQEADLTAGQADRKVAD